MRFLAIYLIGYFVLFVGAGVALWRADVLQAIPGVWLTTGVVIGISLGILLVASRPRAVATELARDI